MTRPLRSTPITGASPLLRVGPPAEPATVLTPTQSAGYSLSPTRETRTGSVGFGLLPFHAEAADRARVASMPDTAWPISGTRQTYPGIIWIPRFRCHLSHFRHVSSDS